MRMLLKNRKGITLVELLVALAISAMIIAATITVMTTGIKTYNVDFKGTVGQQSLRAAMITVTKQVRNAAPGTVAVTGSNVLTVGGKNFTASSGNLKYNGQTLAQNISAVSAGYTDSSLDVVQVSLTSADGNTLSTQIRVNR